MKKGPLLQQVTHDQDRTEQERRAVQKMGEGREPADFLGVDTGDQNLTVGEFEQPPEIGFGVGKCQALRYKNDRMIVALQRTRQGIIVANRVSPLVHHTRLLEDAPANGGASPPRDSLSLFAEHGDQWALPDAPRGPG